MSDNTTNSDAQMGQTTSVTVSEFVFVDTSTNGGDEAYNKLMKQAVSNPTIEIAPHDNTLDVKTWNILLDLEIKIEGLNYNPSQLKAFPQGPEPSHLFAFVLGFLPTGKKEQRLPPSKEKAMRSLY